MKKCILSLFALCCMYAAQAQSCVSVQQVSANYVNKTVTFVLSWSGCNGTNHLNTVWCFVDWRTVDTAGNKGMWTRATISGNPTVTGASSGSVKTGGFWVTGSNSATVTVELGNAPAMFDWCVFASDCENKLQGATVATCTNAAICLGETGFASIQTWVVGAQTWSAPVTATNCNKTAYNGGYISSPFMADCRNNPGYANHFFSWCMVAQYANQLCPSPWRVPGRNDFIALDIAMGGNGLSRADNNMFNKYRAAFGVELSGQMENGAINSTGKGEYYWGRDSYNMTVIDGVTMDIGWTPWVRPDHFTTKSIGRAVRCVRN